MRIISIVLVVGIMVVFIPVAHATDEFTIMRGIYKTVLTGGDLDLTKDYITDKITNNVDYYVNRWYGTMNKEADRTCLWDDLQDLTDSNQITKAYERLRYFAIAVETKGSAFQNSVTHVTDTISALKWLHFNVYNSSVDKTTESYAQNWFGWEIGASRNLADILVLMYSRLTNAEITMFADDIAYFVPNPSKLINQTKYSSGMNLVLLCKVTLERGMILNNSSITDLAVTSLRSIFVYKDLGDGFYTDGSFIQHSGFPYNLGYGKALLPAVVDILSIIQGTSYQIDSMLTNNIYDWVYNGYEPLIYNGAAMDAFRGREISRQGSQEHLAGNEIISAIVQLSHMAPWDHGIRLKAMAKEWIVDEKEFPFFENTPRIYTAVLGKQIIEDNTIVSRGELISHKRYNITDRVVHLRNNFGFSVSMSSSRIANYESIGNENYKAWYTADGMNYIYNADSGQYSNNFWATVNPYRLPGTTVDTQPRLDSSGGTYRSPENWVGGTEMLGLYGVSGMQLNAWNSTLEAKKSWFMFDNEIVCLGSGITSTDNRTIETTIENRKLNGTGDNMLAVNGVSKSDNLGWTETMTGVTEVHLQGNVSSGAGSDIGYYFPGGAVINGLRERRTGSWSDLSSTGSTADCTNNFMQLWYDHGSNPTAQTYSYAILPNVSIPQLHSYAVNPDIHVLENSETAQGVYEKNLNLTAVNFWTDNLKTVGPITSDKKASVMLMESGNQTRVSVSDPTWLNTGYIDISLDVGAASIKYADPGISILQFSPFVKLRVAVNGSKGKTFQIVLSNDAESNFTFLPSADAYVMMGTASANYGERTVLAIKNNTSNSTDRESFLNFDLSGIYTKVISAKLYLYGSIAEVSDNPVECGIYSLNNLWDEFFVTWGNKPEIGNMLKTFDVDSRYPKWYEIDITEYITQKVSEDKIACMALAQNETSNSLLLTFDSREGINKPYIVVKTLGEEADDLSYSEVDGSVIVTANIKNYGMKSDYALILAIYDEKKLISLKSESFTLEDQVALKSVMLALPPDCLYKGFLWRGLETGIPIK